MDIHVKKHRRFSRGFSLLELLTVLIIVGVLAGAVVLSFTGSNERRSLHTHAERLMLSIELARQKSTLANQIWGVRVSSDTYEFVRLLDDGAWGLVADSPFTYFAPGSDYGMRVRLLDGTVIKRRTSNTSLAPDILLFPSGETSPFEIRLTHSATRAERFVIGDGIQPTVVSELPYKTVIPADDA